MPSLISSLLTGSPIKPLRAHMASCQQCVTTLGDFLAASYEQDWDRALELQHSIKRLENEADEQKRAIRKSLTKSLLMPFSRADVISLLAMQDKLANKAKDVAGIMLGRKMVVPESITPQFQEHYLACKEVAAAAATAINELESLLETGFAHREFEQVMGLVEDLDRLEEGCDEKEIQLRKSVMEIEDSLKAVNVIFLYRVIQLIGEIADISERIGNRLLVLVSK